jgi:hypothetical protein
MSKIHTTWKVEVKNSGNNLPKRIVEPDRTDLLNKAHMHTTSNRSTSFNNNIKQLLKTSSLSSIQNIETLLEQKEKNVTSKVPLTSVSSVQNSIQSLDLNSSSSSSSRSNVTSLDNLRNNLHVANASVQVEQKQEEEEDQDQSQTTSTNAAGLTVYHLDYPKTADMFRANANRLRQTHGGIKPTDYGFVDAF